MRIPTLMSCAAAIVLAACGGERESASGPDATRTAGFPVTIDHKYGRTTIPQAPKRADRRAARGKPDYGEDWRAETVAVGRAVGREQDARDLVRRAEGQLAAAAREHPEFKGQTAAVAAPYRGTFIYGSRDPRPRLLADLGFTLPPAIDRVARNRYGGQLSDERLDVLDVGTLVWLADDEDAAQLRAGSLYRRLDVRREGRDVFIGPDDMLYNATSAVTVLSLQPILERYVPLLAAADGGDPATAATPR